jgi:hypothetical protein
VHGPLCSNHALAQQHLAALHRPFLDEVVILHYQHFPDVLGMVQKNNMVASEFVMRDVAVGFGEMLKQKDRIDRAEFAKRVPEKIALKTGRKAVFPFFPKRFLRFMPCRGTHSVQFTLTAAKTLPAIPISLPSKRFCEPLSSRP